MMKRFGKTMICLLILFQITGCQKADEHIESRETVNENKSQNEAETETDMITESPEIDSIRTNLEQIGSNVRSCRSDTKKQSVDFIKSTLEKWNYEVEIQNFNIKQPESLSDMDGKSARGKIFCVSYGRAGKEACNRLYQY